MVTTANVLTVGEVAAFMRVSRETIYLLAAGGELPGREIGRIWQFPEEPIQEYVHGESGVGRVSRTEQGRDRSASNSDDDEKRLRALDEDRVQIEVADNAIGIPPENLTKIFAHGFTTKEEGHGFGLHGSALAAQEVEGSLTTHSDGPGQGATFILELPLQVTEKSDVCSAK